MKLLILFIFSTYALVNHEDCSGVTSKRDLTSTALHWDHDKEGPKIEWENYSAEDCPNCIKVSYYGPLYDACGGGCRVSQYAYLLEKNTGTIKKMCIYNGVGTKSNGTKYQKLETDLSRFNPMVEDLHSNLTEEELKRLVRYANDKDTLKFVEGKSELTKKHVASISKTYEMKKAGNTMGTFIVHVNKVRRLLFSQKEINDELVIEKKEEETTSSPINPFF